MHLDAERVQRILHDELNAGDAAEARAHVETCATCRAAVDEARVEEREVFALLGSLDHAPPAFALAAVRVTPRRQWPLRWAAGITLACVAAGTAFALPGSPLRSWVSAIVARINGSGGRDATSPEPLGPIERVRELAGVIVDPGDRFRIDVIVEPGADGSSTGALGEIVVALRAAAEVRVQSPAGSAVFDTREDRLVIRTHGTAAVLEIEIPQHAPLVEIYVAGRRWMLVQGGRVSAGIAPALDGTYRRSLAP